MSDKDREFEHWLRTLGRVIGVAFIGSATGTTLVAVIHAGPAKGWESTAVAGQFVLCIGVLIWVVARS